MADAAVSDAAFTEHTSKQSSAWLALGALRVVFGDIGTSPLYALL
jgi:K+ transporter